MQNSKICDVTQGRGGVSEMDGGGVKKSWNSCDVIYGWPLKCRIHKNSPIIPILSQINPVPHIDTYFFKIQFNIALPSMPVKFLKALMPSSILVTWTVHLVLLNLFGHVTYDICPSLLCTVLLPNCQRYFSSLENFNGTYFHGILTKIKKYFNINLNCYCRISWHGVLIILS